jgi:septal ring factor EnvC (AmiA/AmiB activator)
MKKLLTFLILAAVIACVALYAQLTEQAKSTARLNVRIGELQAENANLTALAAAQSEAIERIKNINHAQADATARAAEHAAHQRLKSEARAQTILAAPAPDDTQELINWALDQLQKGTL